MVAPMLAFFSSSHGISMLSDNVGQHHLEVPEGEATEHSSQHIRLLKGGRRTGIIRK